MKAVLRFEEQSKGFPVGEIDILAIEEYRRAIAIWGIYYDGDYYSDVTAQIDADNECVEFVFHPKEDS